MPTPPTTLRIVDGRLSQRAQATWPGALVTRAEVPPGEPQDWRLERHGTADVGLGRHYGEAVRALGALVRAAKAGAATGGAGGDRG